jgi:hypothetical protein
MTAELEVLQDAATRLERAGIPYMLTGSIALSYYAQPRMTRDIDLVAELSGRDSKAVAALFAPDYYVAEADVGRAIATGGMFNVLHLGKLVKLDFIVRKDTPYRRHEFERRRRVPMPGFEAWIVSREDLILSKLAWAKDTTPEFRKMVEQGYASMAPEERVRVCTEMFDTAFALVEASMPEGLDPGERRFRLCERIYGDLAARALPRR